MKVKTKGSKSESFPQKAMEYKVSDTPLDAYYVGQEYDYYASTLTRVVAWSHADALARYVASQSSLYSSGSCTFIVLQAKNEQAYTLTPESSD